MCFLKTEDRFGFGFWIGTSLKTIMVARKPLYLIFMLPRFFSTAMSVNKKGALIFLHGLGDTPLGWSSLEEDLPRLVPRLSNLEYIFPPAPTVGITINGGMRMPGWFDIYDWPISVGVTDDKEGKLAAVQQIQAIVEELAKRGISKDRIVVGGFSQGGAIALLTAYYLDNDPPFAGCVVLSGWLTLARELKVSENSRKTPCFWGHGSYDDKVLPDQQKFGLKELTKQGVQVQTQQYPMGHQSHPQEMQDLATFLDQTLFGDPQSEL
jgi:lysophospholipase-2